MVATDVRKTRLFWVRGRGFQMGGLAAKIGGIEGVCPKDFLKQRHDRKVGTATGSHNGL